MPHPSQLAARARRPIAAATSENFAQSGRRLGARAPARGTEVNLTGRFERYSSEAESDGWDLPYEDHLVKTEIRFEAAKSALTRNTSPDIPFDRSINPYRGCEHGCIYCYARPTHGYLNLSAGLDFETKIHVRTLLAERLDQELRAPSYRVAPVALGANTDPWQPSEGRYRATRQVLEVLSAFLHPVTITTRGTLIERDLDLLAPMAAQNLAEVAISITTLDPDLARKLEPRAPSPARRLTIIERLSAAGVPVRVMVAPVIPGLSDHEVDPILAAAAAAGAQSATWLMLRLPLELAPLFDDWLSRHTPARRAKVLARLRDIHGGTIYDARFERRFRGQGVWPKLTESVFATALRKYGLTRDRPPLDISRFEVPFAKGAQLALF